MYMDFTCRKSYPVEWPVSSRMYTTMLSCMRGISTSIRLQFKCNKYYGIIDRATNNIYRQYKCPIVEKLNGGGRGVLGVWKFLFKSINLNIKKKNNNYNEIEMFIVS